MKKIIFLTVLFILPFFPHAQVWNWAKAGVNGVNGACDPIDITTDRLGSIYETGIFDDTTFFGSIILATGDGGQQDAYLVKFDNSGNPLWAVAPVLALRGQAWGFSASTAKTGNVCLAGAYWDTMSINSFVYPHTDVEQIFLATFSSSGTFLWGAYSSPAASGGLGYPSSAVIDDSGNTYLTGSIRDSVYIGSKGVYGGPTPSGSFFLARFDSTGNLKWCITSASGSPSKGLSVVNDRTGNVYVAGYFNDSLTIGSTTIKSPLTLNDNEFVAEFNSSGDLIWLTSPILPSSASYISDLYSLPARVLSIDSSDNLYVTGCFKDTAQFGSYTLITQKLAVFIAKYSPAGNVIWAQQSTHAQGGAVPYSIACDRHSNFYLCGVFGDSIEFKTLALKDGSSAPSFLYEFDSAGNPLCASAVNNQNDDPNTLTPNPLAGGVFFSADIPAPSSCSFGSFLLTGEWGEYEFLASWSCDSNTSTGIKEQTIDDKVKVYPNPTNNTLHIQTSNIDFPSTIDIIDITGRVLLTYDLSLTTYDYSLDVSSLSNGMYFLRINSSNRTEIKKFIKE